jgi:hypothetical protein
MQFIRSEFENVIQTKVVALVKITIAVFGFLASHVFLVSAPWYLRILSVTGYVRHRGERGGKSVIGHGIASQSSECVCLVNSN